jgi:hypothetical protein
VEAGQVPQQRPRRGRPPPTEGPPGAVPSRLVVPPEVWRPAEAPYGWTVLAPTGPPEVGTETALLQASQEQHITVAPGWRGRTHPAARSPGWLETPERRAAWAMLTVVGVLV